MPLDLLTRLRPSRRVTCPHCLRRTAIGRLHLRCDKACRATNRFTRPDPILTRALQGPAAGVDPASALLSTWWTDPAAEGGWLGRLLAPASRTCPVCQEEAEARLCPHCHAHLPDAILLDRPVHIAVFGPQAVGKSTFLTVAVEELERSIGPRLGFVLDPLDEETTRRHRDEYRPSVYGLRERPLAEAFDPAHLAYGHQATRPLAEDPGILRPLAFRIGPQDPTRRRPSVLSLFDCAGEDWEGRDSTFRAEAEYLARARGLLLLLDPLRIEALATDPRLGIGRRELAAKPADYADDIRHLGGFFESRGGRLPSRTPLAVVLSKLDRWARLLPAGSALRELALGVQAHADPPEGFDGLIHEELRSALARWAGDDFLRQLDQKFPVHRLFAVSSLGDADPGAGRPLALPTPLLVDRPILWLLRKQGVLRD